MNRPIGTFFVPNAAFIKELSDYIGDKKALEVYSGNGLLAHLLKNEGVNITPTSIHSDYDNYSNHAYTFVEELSSVEAVLKYGKNTDILLVSWAVADQSLLIASMFWGSSKEIIFIGESYYGEINSLPGCACDDFHDSIEPVHFFEKYTPRNGLERAFSCKFNLRKVSSGKDKDPKF